MERERNDILSNDINDDKLIVEEEIEDDNSQENYLTSVNNNW